MSRILYRDAALADSGSTDWALVGRLAVAALAEGTFRPDIPSRPISIAITLALVPTLL